MLIVEMMARWKIRLSYGAKRDVGEVKLENGIIQGDAFSPLLFVLMIDPLIKVLKKSVGDDTEALYSMDDLKASTSSIEKAATVHETVKRYAASVGMVVNKKKSAIQLKSEDPLTEPLREIPRMDDLTYKYLGFEMKKCEVDRKEMLVLWKKGLKRRWRSQQEEWK